MLSRIPSFVKNFYFIFGFLFILWMIFFDSNDLINQFRAAGKLNDLKKEKAFYEEKIVQVKAEREAFLNNEEALEKFARENYLMKKKGEDVYIVIEEK